MVFAGQNYLVNITGMTQDGVGIGKLEGLKLFVGGAAPGETVEVHITKVTDDYAAGVISRVTHSPYKRVQPICSIYDRCGGCGLQHFNYESQLRVKELIVLEALQREGVQCERQQNEGLQHEALQCEAPAFGALACDSTASACDSKAHNSRLIIHPAAGMDKPEKYRNKMQYQASDCGQGCKLGFYASRSYEVINADGCIIQHELSSAARNVVSRFLNEYGISAYDRSTGCGLVRNVVTRVGVHTGELMVIIVINGDELPHQQALADALVKELPCIRSIVVNINRVKTSSVLGTECRTIYGEPYIYDYIGRLRFRISPLSFFQVNSAQTQVLYDKALEYAVLDGTQTVLDLYCGIGTISLYLASKARKVYGVELVGQAVEDARFNAALNGIDNAEFIEGRAENVIDRFVAEGTGIDTVVLDPPRKGVKKSVIEAMAALAPDRIVYISCNPSTLAEDMAELCDRGFKAVEVQPVDMFPWTGHVESIVLMTNSGLKGK